MLKNVYCGLIGASLSLACQEPEARPDVIEVCEVPGCRPAGAGQGSAGDTSSTTGSRSDEVTLTGDLWLLDDETFNLQRAEPYDEVAALYSFDTRNRLISATYDGSSFTLPGLLPNPAAVVFITPPDDSALAMPTLLRIDTQQSAEVSLPLLRRSVMDEIFAGLSAQVLVDSERAQVIFQFLDQNLNPLSGVEVSVAEADFVAYAAGNSYSDLLNETSAQGLAVVGNVPASDLPGTSIYAQLSGALVGQQVVQVVRGAVSYELIVAE